MIVRWNNGRLVVHVKEFTHISIFQRHQLAGWPLNWSAGLAIIIPFPLPLHLVEFHISFRVWDHHHSRVVGYKGESRRRLDAQCFAYTGSY